MKQSSRLGSFACLLVLHLCTATTSRAATLAGPITNTANGHIYYLLSPTNWPSAEAEAVSLRGHLATINDVAENTWVFNRFGTNGGVARSLWLGLNDAVQEGNWVWVSGEAATYRKWAPGEPNNGGGFFSNEDQAVMRGPALDYPDSWNDAPGEQIHAAVVEVAVSAPPTNTSAYDVASEFSPERNPNAVWSYGSSATLGGPMTLLPDHGNWAGLDYWRAAILLGVPGVYHNPAHISVTNSTGTTVLGPGQLSFYPGPNGEFCVIRFAAPAKGVYQVSGAFTGVDPHGTFTDVHILVNGVIFNGSVTGFGAGSGPTFNLIVNLNTGDPIDFVVGRSANTQFSFDSTGLSVQIIPPLVGIPPTITSQPQSRSVNVGTNVTFFVTATGTAPLSYQWRRNGTNLAGANGSSLTLSNVQPANAGTYSVRVTNAFGAATSSNAVLTVLPPPTNCVVSPTGLVSWWRAENPGIGANTVLDSADANHGTLAGNAGYGAGRIGQALVLDGNGDGVRIGNPTNLQLQNFTIESWIKRSSSSVVSFSLGGLWAEFFCYGTGGYAFGLLNNGQLFLSKVDIDQAQTPVGIGITDTNFHHVAVTKSGSVVVFYIDGAAYPVTPYNTTYTFTSPTAIGVRGDNLSSSFYGTIDELAIYNRALTSAEVQGIYTAGSAGKCPSTAGIPPTITSQPQSRTVNAGTSVTFSVTATGTPPLSYQWRRNETNLPGATGPSLTLSNVQPANAGNYSVRVTNAFGAVTSSNVVLTVLSPPNPILAGPITNPANGHVYFLIASNTWTGAEAHAVTLGGHLVTINDAAENAWVLSAFGSFGGVGRPLWIGLNDAALEGVFVWVSGEAATYRNWMPGEPNNGGGFVSDEDYVAMRGPGLSFSNAWNDTLNSDLYVGVVEIGVAGSSNNCVSSPTGLVSWWRAENNTVDAVDGNNGILSEGVSFITGKVGQAFRFNGTNSQVRVPASTSLNVGLGGGFTIETWINPAQLTSQRPLVEWNDGSTYGVHLWLFAWPNFEDGRALYLNVVDTASQNHGIYTAAGTITTNGYQHVAATYNKTNGVVALYINGTLMVQQSLGVVCTPKTTGDLFFGYRFGGPAAGIRYVGAMDEVSIYNRPLGSNEIAGIFAAGSAGKCPPSGGIAPTITSQPQSRTVNAGTNVTFSVTATGTAPLSYQWRRNETNLPGPTGPSLTLSNVQPANAGVYSVRVTNAFGAVTSSNAVLTVLSPPNPILAGPITNPANGHVYFLIASNTWTGAEAHAVSSGGHLVTINDANENAWVLSTFGNFGGVARPLWIGLNDAALEGVFVWVSGEAATYRNWMPGEPNNGGGFVPEEDYVGMRGPGLSFSNAWNDTLNSDLHVGVVEISPLGPGINCVSPPAGLVSWWRAEGNANDSVGTNNGMAPLEMGYAAGEVGQAFDFNGTSRRVSVPDSPSFKLTNSLTIEAWIYARQSNSGVIFIRGDNRTGLDPMMLNMLGSPGYVRFQIQNAANQSAFVQAPVQLNQWQHIAATLEGTNGNMTLFVNGAVRAQTNTTIRPLANLEADQQPAIGIGNHGGTIQQFPFNGLIDEISLYSRALSQNEIEAIYHAGSNGKCINRTPIAGAGSLTSLVCDPGAKAKLCFAGVAGNIYTVQASTNLIDWEIVGVSVAGPNGVCEFEDADSTRFPFRYYRVILPRPTRSSREPDKQAARVHVE